MMSVATDAMDSNYIDFNSSSETGVLALDSSELDGDGKGDDFFNGFDDISIDLNEIVAILDEDQHKTAESYEQRESAPTLKPSQKIQADMDKFREMGSAHLNLNDIAVMEHPFADQVNVSGSYLANNFNQQPQLQNNMEEYSFSAEEGMKETYTYLNYSNQGILCQNDMNTENETTNTNGNTCSVNTQNGESSSAYIFPLEKIDVNNNLPCITSEISTPGLAVDDGYPSSHYLYMNIDSIMPETNTFDTSLGACDGSNSCLTLPIELSSNAEMALLQKASGQLHAGFSDNLLKTNDYMPPLNKVKLCTEEESPDSPLPEVSISDLDSPFSDELCSEYNHNDDISLTSEPSPDSSPLISAGNTNFDYVDSSFVDASEQALSGLGKIWPSKHKLYNKDDGQDQLHQVWHGCLKGENNTVQSNITRSRVSFEDEAGDADVCILEDISAPACPPQVLYMPQRSEHMGARIDDERLTYRLALQDLSQTKSEASPPDGLLAVPLLKHQRIALAWMVRKETASVHCCGGILADDQGLGKTISTIALILMERSPLPRTSTLANTKGRCETLNLDDDGEENDGGEANTTKLTRLDGPMRTIGRSLVMDGMNMRPAAGTLVVCPTSVLRQWADELQTKVTREANLSFLLYHGCNRTKDPKELAKYDVVLTTYSIVSMEVPKQGLVDKDDEEKEKHVPYEMSDGLPNSKKRRFSSKSSNKKDQTKISARPLGRVGWFRVILDEAQSIKNHRTQVARACWGLRAKRRWCLSGTPIQNAIDDLYSYFRFLRYDPYADYHSFCSTIKNPITRNPTNGYKKLQAVLKTIMLRRTKATILDGKPIIDLPPKTVSLKKVEFSAGEREFYSTLEAASREQFAEYEDAGTVKQNYVNILLMLLRLRQACDHPLMVKVNESNPCQKACLEMARKLPREKRIVLLSYLEVSLAICAICNYLNANRNLADLLEGVKTQKNANRNLADLLEGVKTQKNANRNLADLLEGVKTQKNANRNLADLLEGVKTQKNANRNLADLLEGVKTQKNANRNLADLLEGVKTQKNANRNLADLLEGVKTQKNANRNLADLLEGVKTQKNANRNLADLLEGVKTQKDPPEDVVVTICGHVFCNQCISEHLTTDESICPSPNCKNRLNSVSVFSRSTLESSLTDELGTGCGSAASSDLKEVDDDVKYKSVWSPYSSKIKTVLEILQSLPRYSHCDSSKRTANSTANTSCFNGVKQFKVESSHNLEEISGKAAVSNIKSVKLESSNREVSEKAIIFSQWTKMLDLLEGPLKASGIQYRRLDGTMSVNARDKAIRDFKTLPEVTVIIMSLKAASLGLNLVVANHVILLDLWWNPTTEDQAIDRAHRIGQTRPVNVSRLTVSGTVEDKILKLQEKKREMVASAFGEDESGSRQSRLTVEDLRYLFSSNPSF